MEFLREAVKIAPIYGSRGNHEWGDGDVYFDEVRKTGAVLLENEWVEYSSGVFIGGQNSSRCGAKYKDGKLITEDRKEPDIEWLKDNSPERVLYLDDQTVEVIQCALKLREEKRIAAKDRWDDEYNCLFTYRNGHFIKHPVLRKYFKKMAKEIGRPELKFHHLRHTAATIVNEKLHDIDAAKTLLGHKHYNSTGIYIHSSAEKMKAAAIAISDYTMQKIAQ